MATTEKIHALITFAGTSLVMYGQIDPQADISTPGIDITDARHIHYWSLHEGDVPCPLGDVAVTGPGPKSRIGPTVPGVTRIGLQVAVIHPCTSAAVEQMARQGWGARL